MPAAQECESTDDGPRTLGSAVALSLGSAGSAPGSLPQLSPASSRPNAETATAPEHVPPMQWHTAYWPGEQAGLQTTNPQTSFGRGCDTTSAETGARLRSVVCLQEGLEMQRSARMPHWMSPQVLRFEVAGTPCSLLQVHTGAPGFAGADRRQETLRQCHGWGSGSSGELIDFKLLLAKA